MKKIYISIVTMLIILSCKKQEGPFHNSPYLDRVKASLKDSLSGDNFFILDFDHTVLSEVDSMDFYCLRIPIKGKDLRNDFVIVKTDMEGIVERGKWIHLDRDTSVNHLWNGQITISSLSKERLMHSAIKDGYVIAFQERFLEKTQTMAPIYPDPYLDLPEVVVVTSINNGGGISYSTWIELQSLYSGSGSSGSDVSGYYAPMDGGRTVAVPGTGSNATTSNSAQADVIKIDFENQFQNPAIDLSAYLKCFSKIPDAGSTCTIKILTDIPVDDNPNEFFDWHNGSPGHTFIQLEKVNGSQIAYQNIGFYPKIGWKTAASPAPLPGKFVDNSKHEYNASLQMNITPAQLQSAVTEMQYLAKFVKYDIDEYNCTDWALEVFNYIRHPSNQLIIPKFDLPYGEAPNGSNTPEGLYLKLQEMKKANMPDANNISIGFKKAFVGESTGPCN